MQRQHDHRSISTLPARGLHVHVPEKGGATPGNKLNIRFMKSLFTSIWWAVSMLTVSLFFLTGGTSFATDRYVKAGGSGTQSGTDWDNAMSSIAAAITAANAAAPALNNVYVAAGLYSLSAQITIPNVNMNIQGGFPASATGTTVTGYDPTTNITTINGNGFGMFQAGASGIGYSNDLIIKGFTLTEGVATSGSIFYEASSTSATCSYLFEDLRCINNWASNGAFFFTTVNGPTVDFKNCEFNACNAFNGGAIHITTASNTTFTIDGCSFSNCTAENGGAIYNSTGPTNYKMLIKNSSFCNNQSSLYGGAIYTTTAPIKIVGCSFTNNSTKMNYWGGAIFATTSSVDCTNSTFYGNHADLGGAVYQTTAQTGLITHYDNCKFAYNYNMDQQTSTGAADGGGALHLEGTSVNFTIDGSSFYRNSVPGNTFGGAILASGAAVCTSMNGTTFLENRIGTSTTLKGADFISYDGTNRFQSIQNTKLQLASSSAYLNQTGTPTGGYTFGAGNTFSNTMADGGAAALTMVSCPVNVLAFGSATGATSTGAGTVDCAKTQLSPAPVSGTASQVDLIVTVNVTTAGTLTLSASDSGMSLANGIASISTTTTGIQTFHIPLKYDGTALGTLSFTVGTSSCTADLTKAPKKAISNVWTLDCIPTAGPALK
jgi:predicted outer membrane repeat protein